MNVEDVKLYQNRAVAYRDYGVLKGQKIPNFYDKNKAISSFKSCISDFEKGEKITELECKHILHTECISEWVKYKSECPVCRSFVKTIKT